MIHVNRTKAPTRDSNDVVALADYLVSQLLTKSPASLRADTADAADEIVWHLNTAEGTEPLCETRRPLFRSVLARIGFHYMNGQLYGGKSRVRLKRDEQEFVAVFEMANSSTEGFRVAITVENAA